MSKSYYLTAASKVHLLPLLSVRTSFTPVWARPSGGLSCILKSKWNQSISSSKANYLIVILKIFHIKLLAYLLIHIKQKKPQH